MKLLENFRNVFFNNKILHRKDYEKTLLGKLLLD